MSIPYGNTASVDDTGISFDCTSSGKPAVWLNIKNRDDSANSFDVSYDGGTTYITRLSPGSSMAIGGEAAMVNRVDTGYIISISSIHLKCSDSGGTATAEITCSSGVQ